MKKSVLTLSAIAAIATPLATVISCEQKTATTNDVLKNINTELNQLAGLTGHASETQTYEEFYNEIIAPFDPTTPEVSNESNVISALITQTDIEIDQIIQNIKNQSVPAGQEATNTFIGNQLQTYFDELDNLSTQISSGYVGSHDINYYKTLIDEKVEKVIFDSNTDTMNVKIQEAKDQIESVNSFLTNDLNLYKTEIADHIESIHTTIAANSDANKLELEKVNSDLIALVQSDSNVSQEERNIITAQLASQLTLIVSLQTMANKTYQDLVDSNANINASIDSIMEKANTMELELDQLNSYLIGYDTYVSNLIPILEAKIDQNHIAALTGIQENYTKIFVNTLDIIANKDKIDNISVKLTEFENKLEVNRQNIEDLDDKLLNAEANLSLSHDQLDQKIDTNMRLTDENIVLIKARMDAHDNAISTIETALSQNHSLASDNQAILSTVQNSIANIFNLIEQLTTLADENQAKIWHIESEVQALRDDINNLSSDIIFSTNFQEHADNTNLFTQRWHINDIKSYSSIRIIYELENDNFSTSTFDIALIPGDAGIRVYNHDGTIFQAHEYSMKAIINLDENFIQLTSPRTSTLGIRGYEPKPLDAKILSVIANKIS